MLDEKSTTTEIRVKNEAKVVHGDCGPCIAMVFDNRVSSLTMCAPSRNFSANIFSNKTGKSKTQ